MQEEFDGSGTLSENEETLLNGKFHFSHEFQRPNGLQLKLEVNGIKATQKAYETFSSFRNSNGRDAEDLSFKGISLDKKELKIRGLIPINLKMDSNNQATLKFTPLSTAEIGSPQQGCSNKFFIPNLLFQAISATKYRTGEDSFSSRKGKTIFEIDDSSQTYLIKLKQLPDYDEAIREIKNEKKSQWTSTLQIELAEGQTIDLRKATEVAEDFMLLMSFAAGRRLTWVTATLLQDEKVIFQRYKVGSTPARKVFPGNALDTQKAVSWNNKTLIFPYYDFINEALPKYFNMNENKRKVFKTAITNYCETMQNYFSPSTITLTSRAFEVLMGEFLNDEERQYSLNTPEMKLAEELRKGLEEFVGVWSRYDRDSACEFKKKLNGNIGFLLRRSMKLRLKTLLNKHLAKTGNKYDKSWVKDFINARHAAAHQGEVGGKEYVDWQKGISLLERLILKLFGYSGPYRDRFGRSSTRLSKLS